MIRRNARDYDQALLDLYDHYIHNRMSRNDFFDKASKYTLTGDSVSTLIDKLSTDVGDGHPIDEKDSRIQSEFIEYDSPRGHGKIRAYLTRPANNSEQCAGIVVIHENCGLNPYIKHVTRQFAVAGFIALAPDALTPLGGYPHSDQVGIKMLRKLGKSKLAEDFETAYKYFETIPGSNGKIGAVGFCFGGWIANMMAIRLPRLAAAVSFYGRVPAIKDVAKIEAPLLLHYAGLDQRVNQGWHSYQKALDVNNKEYTAYLYPEVNHGFHNYSSARFDKAAADIAWQRTIDFFIQKLR